MVASMPREDGEPPLSLAVLRDDDASPAERMRVLKALRDSGADIEFTPADFRRFGPLLERQCPRVMTTVAAAPDADGWCSLALHAGGTAEELRRAGADPNRLLIVEASDGYPRTFGHGDHRHALHVDEIDILIRSSESPLELPEPEPSDADRAIAEHAVAFIRPGSTLQTGIGSIPSQIATLLNGHSLSNCKFVVASCMDRLVI